VAAVSALEERVIRLIRRYATPDLHGGGALPPADICYRLSAWHGVEITREQVDDVLRGQR
jgi:hypothetical protein